MSRHQNGTDLQLLEWLGRIGGASAQDLALALGLASRQAADRRLRRLEQNGMLSQHRLLHRRPGLWLPTARGLRAASASNLGPCQVSAAGFEHLLACGHVAARLTGKLGGDGTGELELWGERELRVLERAAGQAIASARIAWGAWGGEVLHRPDLVLHHSPSGQSTAVEVELSVKAPARLREIVRGWARSRNVKRVVYLCSGPAARAVERAIAQEHAAGRVLARRLAGWRPEALIAGAQSAAETKSFVTSHA